VFYKLKLILRIAVHKPVSLSSEMDDQQALCPAIGNPQKVSQHAGLSSFASARRPQKITITTGAFPDPEQKLQSALSKNPLEKRMTSPDEGSLANCSIPALCPRRARNRPACVRGWRLRAPRSSADLRMTTSAPHYRAAVCRPTNSRPQPYFFSGRWGSTSMMFSSHI